MDKKTLIIFIVVVLVVAGVVYYVSYQRGYKTGYDAGYDAGKEAGIAAQKTTAGEVVQNPLEEMPSTNPFEEVVNPFKELYKNPFK